MHVADDLNPWENVCFLFDLLIRYKLRQFPGFVQDEKICCTKYTRDASCNGRHPKSQCTEYFFLKQALRDGKSNCIAA